MAKSISEKALKSQIAKLQGQLQKVAARRSKVIRAVVKQIETHDITLAEIKEALDGKVAKNATKRVSHLKGKKAPVKYRDKQGNTWSGRGQAPRWLVAAEKTGKKREEFLIQ